VIDAESVQPMQPRWVLRALGALGCVAYGAFALISGLDREATADVNRPALVHWPYSLGAEFGATADAIRHRDAPRAMDEGRHLVEHAPGNARSISMYGTALLAAKKPEQARQAFVLAAHLGWRDQATQQYWFKEGLQQGDAELASRHLDAMLRQDPDLPDRDKFLRGILAYYEGRAAIAARLRDNPEWLVAFVSQVDGLDIDDLAARADVVQRVGQGHWDCAAAANLIDALIVNGLPDEANAVHKSVCAGIGSNVNDGDFNQFFASLGASALDWNITRRGDMVTSISAETPRTHVVGLSVTAASTVMALWQLTTAGPGTYRLIWRMPDTSASDATALLASFDCVNDQSEAVNGKRLPGPAPFYEARFVIPQTCPMPVVRFWLLPNHPVNLAGVRLSRISSSTRPGLAQR